LSAIITSTAALATAATTLIITSIVSIILSSKGSYLNRIIVASFVIKLVDKEVKYNSFILVEITTDILRFVRIGILNSKDKLVYNTLLKKD
jgi:hypothetical protein